MRFASWRGGGSSGAHFWGGARAAGVPERVHGVISAAKGWSANRWLLMAQTWNSRIPQITKFDTRLQKCESDVYPRNPNVCILVHVYCCNGIQLCIVPTVYVLYAYCRQGDTTHSLCRTVRHDGDIFPFSQILVRVCCVSCVSHVSPNSPKCLSRVHLRNKKCVPQ